MAKQPKPGDWKYSVGDVPLQLQAYERAERAFGIYTRVWTGKQPYREKNKFLCDTIRDYTNKIVPAKQLEAQKLANARQEALSAGIEDEPTGPLTLPAAFRLYLHRDGKFASNTTWKQDVTRYSATICAELGAGVLASTIKHAHYRKLWRRLAESDRGFATTEKIVGVLRSLIAWLQQEGYIEAGTGLPAPRWKSAMREEYAEITKAAVPEPAKPRYTREQSAKMWAAMPKADPRIHLAGEIGAELRLGQVPRSRRSDVLPHGGHAIGAVVVHGKGKKHGAVVVLTDEQRAVLTHYLTDGYLRELEAAYQAGKIKDYYLLPQKPLRTVDGVLVARVENGAKPWGKTGMARAWRALEAIAGVEHVEHRLWYGMRRRAADDAEDVETDARVLNKLGAWKHTGTREGYQEQGRMDIAERAAAVRQRIRPAREP